MLYTAYMYVRTKSRSTMDMSRTNGQYISSSERGPHSVSRSFDVNRAVSSSPLDSDYGWF